MSNETDSLEIDDGLFEIGLADDVFAKDDSEESQNDTEDIPFNTEDDDPKVEDDPIVEEDDTPIAEADDVEPEPDPEPEANEPNYNEFAEELAEKYGVRNELSDEQKDELSGLEGEDWVDRYMEIQKEADESKVFKAVDDLIESITDDNLKQAIALGTQGMSFEEAVAIVSKKQDAYSISADDIDDSTDIQKQVIRQYLKAIGTDDDIIDDQIEVLETTDKLASKAKDYHTKNIKHVEKIEARKVEETKKGLAEEKQRVAQIKSQYENTIENIQEIVPGKKFSNKDKSEIKDFLFNKVETTNGPMTQIQIARGENPVEFDIWLATMVKGGYHKKDSKAWETVKRAGKTEQTSKVIAKLKGNNIKGKGAKATDRKSGENFIVNSFLK